MLEIIWEDADIIVVYKPAGVESQSSRGFSADMVSEIKRHIHKSSPDKGEPYLGVIHRLDKPVSGILVYAKTKKAAADLSRQVSDRSMTKKYKTVLCGNVVDKVDNYVDYLLKDGKTNTSRIVDKGITGAKRAELHLQCLQSRVVEPYGWLTLAEVQLITGRHHQIRVQMAGHGWPIWGDNKYNPLFQEQKSTGSRPKSVALASCELSFHHPAAKEIVTYSRKPSGSIFDYFKS
ncbi:MAG: RluA family pseudouridine synthase [Lachnospiraceae bacterium]